MQNRTCPRVPVIIAIFRVSSYGDSDALSDARVERINRAERVGVDFVVGEGAGGARLEGDVVTSSFGIKSINASQDGVGVLAGTTAACVGIDVRSGPEVLHVAEDLGGLRVTPRARCANPASKGASLNKSTVLVDNGEEGHAVDLLPEI